MAQSRIVGMEIKEQKMDDLALIKIEGRLDSATSGQFGERLLKLIDEGNAKLVLDLSDLSYISSAGLRVFLTAAKRIESRKGRIFLCCMRSEVKDVFDISGFTPLFEIFPTQEDARNSLRK
jgi:anti-anti-sigma factor